MGACHSSLDKKPSRSDHNPNLDFEYFRDIVRMQNDSKVYEVNVGLYDVINVNPRVTKHILVCKYLFFSPNGKFTSRIKKNVSGEEILVEGSLDKNGNLILCYKEKMLSNNMTKVRYYEGSLIQNDKGLSVVGQISEDIGEGKVLKNDESFVLDFTTSPWTVEYVKRDKRMLHVFANLKIQDSVFSGISHDEKGYAVWAGVDDKNKISLVQQYMDKEYFPGSPALENGTFSYTGIMDKINHTIEGVVKNKELDNDTKFIMKYLAKCKV